MSLWVKRKTSFSVSLSLDNPSATPPACWCFLLQNLTRIPFLLHCPTQLQADKVGCWLESRYLAVSPGCLVCSKVLCLTVRSGTLWSKTINVVLYFTTLAHWGITLVANAIPDLGKEALNHFCMLQGRLFLPPSLFYCFQNFKEQGCCSLPVHVRNSNAITIFYCFLGITMGTWDSGFSGLSFC